MPNYSSEDVYKYLWERADTSQKASWEPKIPEIVGLLNTGKMYSLAEAQQWNDLSKFQNRQTIGEVNLASMVNSLTSIGRTTPITQDIINRNIAGMALSSEDTAYVKAGLEKQFLTGVQPTATPTPLGAVSNQPSSGPQIGTTTGGVPLYGKNEPVTETQTTLTGGTVTPQPGQTQDPLAAIRTVFGAQWQPSPAFTPALQAQGIYGAVRVGDSPNVFTLGPGGTLETAESFQQKFGTSDQTGIVGVITPEQANQLGINPASVNAPPQETNAPSGETTGGTEVANGETTPAAPPADPYATFTSFYSNLVQSSGMLDIKAEFDRVQKEYADLAAEESQKIMEVNDNPWLSESLRSKKVGLITDKYTTQKASLIQQQTLYQGMYDSAKEDIKFQATQATNMAHQQAVLDQNLLLAQMDAAEKLMAARKGTVDQQNYEYAVDQGYTGSFTTWQKEQANLKETEKWSSPFSLGGDIVQQNMMTGEIRTAVNLTGGGTGGMTPGQISAFNTIVGKYNSSPLILASDRTIVLKNTIDQIKKTPDNAALQLNLVYSYVQALDTYQSAVREGELGLVNSIDSKIGQLQSSVQKIQNGQIVRPEVALQIADAASQLVNTISSAAQSKAKSFQAQANTIGIGDAWKQYMGGFTPSYNPITPSSISQPSTEDLDYTIRQNINNYKTRELLSDAISETTGLDWETVHQRVLKIIPDVK
jgi:hypothetical protein